MIGFRTGSGRPIRLTSILGKGGEGTVFHVDGDKEIAAKVYTDGKSLERRDKILTMVGCKLHTRSSLIAFPIDTLLGDAGQFVGFTMRKVGKVKPIHELYAPGSRKINFPKVDFRFLARTATNLARAVAGVHQTECVIGDINHSGVLVNGQATVTLIDADSFQVRSGTVIYRCRVGVGEYMPPELQGAPLHKVDREPTHDAFGLAVMVFQLLFMGRHPFAGRFGGTGDMPIEKAIKEGRFAYSIQRKAETRMDPPPFVPTLIDITPELAACFERAFPSDPALFKKRPLAADWMHALNRFESELTTCRANPAHYHARNASDCPWCRLENGLGVTLFPLTGITASSAARSSFNLDAAMAAIDRVLGPGEAPNPVQVIPPISGLVKSPAAREIRRDRMTKRVGGLLLAAACIALMISGFPLAFLGLLAAGYMVLGGDDASRRLQADKSRAESDWNAVVKEWENEVGPGRFEHKKMELGKLANEYRLLPALERSRLDDLDRKRREIQLQRFLEGHLIARAKITGIGAGRKATLASYGIENAFDVTFQRVSAVPGFGEVRTKKLVDWRKSVERRFVFNPTLGTDPAAIQQVKDGLARRGIEIEQALARGPIDLEQLRTHAISSRTRPTHRLIEAYRATKQAEIDIS